MLTSAVELKLGQFVVTPDKDLMRITDVDRNENGVIVDLHGMTRNGGKYVLTAFNDQKFFVSSQALWCVTHQYDGGMTSYLVAVDTRSADEFIQDEPWMVEKLNINYYPSSENLLVALVPNFDHTQAANLKTSNGEPIPFYIDYGMVR
jgi:hypothetical protein